MSCFRCRGYVYRDQYDDPVCLQCGRSQRMAVDIEAITTGGKVRREPVMGKAGPECSECGAPLSLGRNKTGKCAACYNPRLLAGKLAAQGKT